MKYDPLKYIRDYYGVPATKGKIVNYIGKLGIITGASGPHVRVRLEGEKTAGPYHPNDLEYDQAPPRQVNNASNRNPKN